MLAEPIISPRVRLVPNWSMPVDPAASDPSSLEDEEGLASIAYLAGVDVGSATAVTGWVNSLTNTTLSQVQGATA